MSKTASLRGVLAEARSGTAPSLPDSGPLPRLAILLSVLALVAVPLVMAFRGLDMTDTGFVAVNQQLIFSAPSAVSFWFHLWLTNVIGGLVYLAFGQFGLLPMKLAAALIFWLTAWAAIRLYGRSMPRHLLFLGVAAPLAFDFAGKINIVHYNNLSALSLALGAWLLVEGCFSGRRGRLFASGFVLGLNVLVRLPNVVGLGLIILVPILNLLAAGEGPRIKLDARGLLLYLAGAILALAAGFAAMAALGHLGLYLGSLKDLAVETDADGSKYGVLRVLLRPARAGLFSVIAGLACLLALLGISRALGRLRRPGVAMIIICAGSCLFALGLVTGLLGDPIGTESYWAMAGTGYLCALVSVLLLASKTDARFRLASAMAAAVVIVLSVGSDTGIKVSTYAFPLLVPAVLGLLHRLGSSEKVTSGRSGLALAGAVFLGVLIPASAYGLAIGVYRDSSAMVSTVDHPMLRGIFTSPARAAVLEEALPVISSYAPPGSELLAFDSIGLVHFATKTRPYLDNPWPALYLPGQLRAIIAAKEASRALPVVVLAKRNARSATWPGNVEIPVRLESVLALLDRHRYHIVWQNDAFAIYLPGKE